MRSKAVLAVAAVAAALLIGYGVGTSQPRTTTSANRAAVSVTVRPTATGRPTSPGHTARVSLGAYKTTPKPEQQTYILNKNTKKFHYPYCSSVNDMKDKNRQDFNGTKEEAIALGYEGCKICNP